MTALILISTTFALIATVAAAGAPSIQVRTSEAIVATWTCQDRIPAPHTAAYSPWKPHSASFRRAQLNLWTNRLNTCRAFVAERTRQWAWQSWLPDKWQRLGACETGDGQRPGNWFHHNSEYVSAFGIQRGAFDGAYDHDAAAVGMPPWSDDVTKMPTPWQQWQTALSHYKHHHGFSGWGCKGA